MNKSLDHSASMAADPGERELPELEMYKEVSFSTGAVVYVGYGYGQPYEDRQESDWIPAVCAAHICGVSKQAISDRIRRGTLEARERQRCSWWNGADKGAHVKLVRLGDVQKKRRAGRPKGSRNKPALQREGFEAPVYFKYRYRVNKGDEWTYACKKIFNGHHYNYTDESFQVLDPDYGEPRKALHERSVECDIYNHRKNNYPGGDMYFWEITPSDGPQYTNWNGNTKQIRLDYGSTYWVKPKDEPDCWIEAEFIGAMTWYWFRTVEREKFAVKNGDISVTNPEEQLNIDYTDADGIEVKGLNLKPERFEEFKAHWVEIGGPEGHGHWRKLMDQFEPDGDQFKWMAIMDKVIDSI